MRCVLRQDPVTALLSGLVGMRPVRSEYSITPLNRDFLVRILLGYLPRGARCTGPKSTVGLLLPRHPPVGAENPIPPLGLSVFKCRLSSGGLTHTTIDA